MAAGTSQLCGLGGLATESSRATLPSRLFPAVEKEAEWLVHKGPTRAKSKPILLTCWWQWDRDGETGFKNDRFPEPPL